MHIAAVQLNTRWEDRPATHARVRRLLDTVELPARTLVVLPEMFDTGFSVNTKVTDPGEPSVSEDFCRSLARDRNIAVLAGMVARAEGGVLANEAIAFGPDGNELVRYRKMQPFTPPGEQVHYPPGHASVGFKWEDLLICPFICYDLRFPELFRPAARAGAECFVVVANWPTRRSEHWVRLLQARAIENQAFVLGVNRSGTDPTFTYDGRSSLFDPMGKSLFEAGPEERVILADINPIHVRDWREEFPALRDMRE
jgi:omega-amidase